jgi:hypothetical protein
VTTVEVNLICNHISVYPKYHPLICHVSEQDSFTRPKANPCCFDFETDMKRLEKDENPLKFDSVSVFLEQ